MSKNVTDAFVGIGKGVTDTVTDVGKGVSDAVAVASASTSAAVSDLGKAAIKSTEVSLNKTNQAFAECLPGPNVML